MTAEKIDIARELQRRWAWIPNWTDESETSAGGLVEFSATFNLNSVPADAILHCSADTRYKLLVNGTRAAVGPARGCSRLWYYDTIDIAPLLAIGQNTIVILVLRMYPGKQTAHAFARTRLPGLTVFGTIVGDEPLDVSTDSPMWIASRKSVTFPYGSKDDVFLHVFEQTRPDTGELVPLKLYRINIKTGEIPPWDLHPRLIPLQEESEGSFSRVIDYDPAWTPLLSSESVSLPPGTHRCVLQASEYLTAFLRVEFVPSPGSTITIKYAESFEQEPTVYPWLRNKSDRLDSSGMLLGPSDTVDMSVSSAYEPFWYRAFRFLEITVNVGQQGATINSIKATQSNYPLVNAASWTSSSDEMNSIWDVSVRTLRNCLWDGVSDCPFYEQLQYAEDTRSSGLFLYALTGDDRLMRQAIVAFGVSLNPDGMIQARYPSHVQQLIPGFALFWVLQVCDYYQHFGDAEFVRRWLPAIDMVLGFFRRHIDECGLVSGISDRYWQFVDWATPWQGSSTHDGGVPAGGRASNTYTYASMLLAYTAQHVSRMGQSLGKMSLVQECDELSASLRVAVNTHCYDGQYYLDSTIDQPHELSQHCQIFAVLANFCTGTAARKIIIDSFKSEDFAKCSYVFTHYAFRALVLVDLYEAEWDSVWAPWRKMQGKNLCTWEEDTVTQRSDCHAWGSVALYEYTVEVAGLHCDHPGWTEILFKPRVNLLDEVNVGMPAGKDNRARVSWKWESGKCRATLKLDRAVRVRSSDKHSVIVDHGTVDFVELAFDRIVPEE